jgi:hypothetical protein
MVVATIQIDGTEYLNTEEAASSLGLTVDAINKAIARGALKKARKMGFYNLFDPAEIERYRAENLNRPGRKSSNGGRQEKN